jgi:hypothetical protein
MQIQIGEDENQIRRIPSNRLHISSGDVPFAHNISLAELTSQYFHGDLQLSHILASKFPNDPILPTLTIPLPILIFLHLPNNPLQSPPLIILTLPVSPNPQKEVLTFSAPICSALNSATIFLNSLRSVTVLVASPPTSGLSPCRPSIRTLSSANSVCNP